MSVPQHDWARYELDLRVTAADLVAEWSSSRHADDYRSDGQPLADLLGVASYGEISRNMTPEIRRKLELLVGPNGYTVYKAMLARKQE